ncbi:MAG: putative Epoxide hydrolase [Subtercola sp.]|nr:putative Epoxide hydrolase [Subtercola sp.]
MKTTLEVDSATPAWFAAAVGTLPTERDIIVNGARIHYRSWGAGGAREILLVHGGAAHSSWWDHIAPLLAQENRVVALDLSGHGDSDHRERYGVAAWAAEALAVADDAGFTPGYTVIGHSLGGLVTLAAARSPRSPLSEAIIIDSPVGAPGSSTSVGPRDFVAARRRHYSTATEAISRFRPVPPQPSLDYVAEYIAANSVVEGPEGWTWKFDSRILSSEALMAAELTTMDCRWAFFRAENGVVDPSARGAVVDAGGIFVELPTTGHAPMLDQPLALVTGIRTVLGSWDAGRVSRH